MPRRAFDLHHNPSIFPKKGRVFVKSFFRSRNAWPIGKSSATVPSFLYHHLHHCGIKVALSLNVTVWASTFGMLIYGLLRILPWTSFPLVHRSTTLALVDMITLLSLMIPSHTHWAQALPILGISCVRTYSSVQARDIASREIFLLRLGAKHSRLIDIGLSHILILTWGPLGPATFTGCRN